MLETLKASAPAKVVTVASRAHLMAYQGLDWPALQQATRSLTGTREYGVSKLANILFSAHLAKALAGTGVSTYSLHPGVVDTEVWRELPGFLRPLLRLRGLLTPEEGRKPRFTAPCKHPPVKAACTTINPASKPHRALHKMHNWLNNCGINPCNG